MKKLLLLLFILIFHSAFAQKMPSDYFDEGEKYYEEKNYDKALSTFQFIVDNYPKDELFPMALFNVGYLYSLQNDYRKAITVFKSILESDFNEKDKLGGGIMADPYTNYKHRASNMLSDLYFNLEVYDSSLYYFSLSDTLYPYLHFCGNELAENQVYKSLQYAKIFEKLNQSDKIVGALLPSVFIELADNSQVITELERIFKENIKNQIKKEFDEALNKIVKKSVKYENSFYDNYYVNFMQTEIEIPYQMIGDKYDKKKTIKKIHNTDFYKMIKKL